MDHNHQPKILHHDQYGYVAYCKNCQGFKVGFGNVYLNQSLADFKGFAEIIHRQYVKCANCDQADYRRRDIHIGSPYPGFGLLFSAADVERLNHMLQKTLLIIASKAEIRLQ
ncbi:MAG: DUF6686 family protein [Bacteroidota bacterium]